MHRPRIFHPCVQNLLVRDASPQDFSSLRTKSSRQGCIAPGFFISADRIQKRYPQVIVSYFAILKIYDTITDQIKTTFLILRAEALEKLLKKANSKEDYDEIADDIFKLREQRDKCTKLSRP